MPLCAMHTMIRGLHVALVTLAALGLAACGSEVPSGKYAASCDELATIDFKEDGVADVNRNLCEGYAPEVWDYEVDGDVLTMAPQGKLGDPDIVQETFEMTEPGELLQLRESSFIACGNCRKGDVWVEQ